MKILKDFILYFAEEEWKSFPQKLQDKLFGSYREYVNYFEKNVDEGLELTNSIKISLEDFRCALMDSEIEEGEFEKWMEERDYDIPFNEIETWEHLWFYNPDGDGRHYIHKKKKVFQEENDEPFEPLFKE